MSDPNINMNLWTGDVWKAIVLLRLDEKLDIVVGDFDMGIALVKKRNNQFQYNQEFIDSLLLLPNPSEIITELKYNLLQNNRAVLLQLRTIKEIKEWL